MQFRGMRLLRIPLILLLTLGAAAGVCRPHPAAKSKPATKAKAAAKRATPPWASSAAAKAVAVEIRAQASGPLKRFYASRGFWPLWADGGRIGPEADILLDDLATARLDGV